jgi:hypothetical protein
LLEIRNRRSGDSKHSFLSKKENFVLAGGIIYTYPLHPAHFRNDLRDAWKLNDD